MEGKEGKGRVEGRTQGSYRSGKTGKVREFEWSGKVRENAKITGKSWKFWGKILLFLYSCCNANNSRAGVQSTIL